MPDNPLRTRFRNAVAAALAEAHSANDLAHPGLVGTIRELVVEKLLRPIVPPEIEFGTGKLVDSNGRLSSQIDVVVYAPQVMPPFLHDARHGVFPVESCLYAIEVKSLLTKQEVKSCVGRASEIRKLNCTRTEYWVKREVWNGPTPHPISALVALGSDLKGSLDQEIERYAKVDAGAEAHPAIGVCCIVGKGYFYHRKTGSWGKYVDSGSHEAVLSFLAGLANTLPQFLEAKGRPRFGNYLIDEPAGDGAKQAQR